MQKHVILLTGFAKNDKSYQKLLSTAPKNWDIFTFPIEEILHYGSAGKIPEMLNNILIDKKIDKITLIAHSLGGAFAIDFISAYPYKVTTLLLANPVILANPVPLIPLLVKIIHSNLINLDKQLSNACLSLLRIIRHPFLYYQLLNYGRKIDFEAKTYKITTPTTILWGNKDFLLPLEHSTKLHTDIKNSQLTILNGMDHNWLVHSPELMWENLPKS